MIHTVKGFGVVNMAEVNIFLEFSCFFYDLVDVGNLISGSSAFSKSSLNINYCILLFWMCWVFVVARGPSCGKQGLLTSCGARLLFVVASLGAEHGLQAFSCHTRAQ